MDLILGAAFVVAAVNAGRCLHCLSGKFGSDKPFKVARYVIYDDAIIAVRISTNVNDINNNYTKKHDKSKGMHGRRRVMSGRGEEVVSNND